MSALTMQSDQATMSTLFNLADLDEEKEDVEVDDPRGPLKDDDPEYPTIANDEDNEYETDDSSDMEDDPNKKKKKKGDEIAGKGSNFVKQRKEMQDLTTKRILSEIMPYFEEYTALDAPPPPKPKGKCSQWCARVGKYFGCLRLDIHEAVMSGSEQHIDATLEFIHQGKKSNRVKLNVYNREGCTALSLAVKSRQTPMAFAILGRKVEPDVPDLSTGRTPLFYACMQGDFKLNKLLLLNGADPNYGDFDCVTPLMMAGGKGDATTVDFMCNMKGKILDLDAQDLNGWTSLHYAAYRNGHKAIKVLLDNGADRNVRDVNGRKPLHIARHFDRGDSIAVLEDTKARLAFAAGEDD